MPAILAAADLYVHPSLWEGFGLAILEAMTAGACVVASRVSTIPEVVLDGETRVLVPPRDSAALARAILQLLADPGRRQQMGEAGRRRVLDMFTVERMVRATEMVYEELLDPATPEVNRAWAPVGGRPLAKGEAPAGGGGAPGLGSQGRTRAPRAFPSAANSLGSRSAPLLASNA